jgi:4-amino-4-deoxy-L-arabinose transferase-like glycosyltransferase
MQSALEFTPETSRKLFWTTLLVTLGVRLWLATVFPFSGDEVYYWDWGRHPSLVYYDQPPMVGWILAPIAALTSQVTLLRLPAVLTSALLAWLGVLTARRLRPEQEAHAWLTGTILLLAPHLFLNIFITTDTPLLAFTGLSTYFFLKLLDTRAMRDALITGALLRLAFLSKYFAVLWVAAFLPLLLVRMDSSERKLRLHPTGIADIALVLAGFLPGVVLHLYLNWQECWINLVFNFLTRHKKPALDFSVFGGFLAQQGYLLLPLGIALLGARIRSWRDRSIAINLPLLAPLGIFAAGILAFSLSALRQPQGLNWSLGQHAALWLSISLLATPIALQRMLPWIGGFTLLHVPLVLGVAFLPTDWLAGHPLHRHAVFFRNPSGIAAQVESAIPPGTPITTNSYTLSSMLGWATEGRVDAPILLSASKFGRNTDLLHDLQAMDGKDIAVFSLSRPKSKDAKKYFKSFERIPLERDGARFWVLLGRGFDFQKYRESHLKKVLKRFYPQTDWLPCGPCRFRDRYFASEAGSCRAQP